jgi:hypothetical protein
MSNYPSQTDYLEGHIEALKQQLAENNVSYNKSLAINSEFQSEVVNLAHELAELREKLRWIPGTERLPEIGDKIEVKESDGDVCVYKIRSENDIRFICDDDLWRKIPELED